jgi:zinc transport system permease protein
MQFFAALSEFPFLQYALLGGLLASVAAGIMGTYVVTRRISYLAGSIAHFVLGGMGAARYLSVVYQWRGLTPLHGAIAAALLAAFIVTLVSLRSRQREDTVIGALWAVGMATGIIFIARTPGYNEDLMSYLFGNILMVGADQLWLLLILDAVVLFFGILCYHPLLAVCFDEEFARIRGLPVDYFYGLLLVLTALTVVVLTTVVGIVMVIALLTLPAAVASLIAHRMWQIMLLATLLSIAFTTSGLALSYGPNYPAGATIILVAGACYLFALLARALWSRRLSKS